MKKQKVKKYREKNQKVKKLKIWKEKHQKLKKEEKQINFF